MQQQRQASQRHARQLVLPALVLALAVFAHGVAADVKQLSSAVLGEQPGWMLNRSADIVLDFRKADPTYKHPSLGVVAVRGKPMKVNFHIGYYHGNVAIVRFGSKFVLAVRKMHFYKTLRSDLEGYPLSDKKGAQLAGWEAGRRVRQGMRTCCVD
jgi:hypothetical protein